MTGALSRPGLCRENIGQRQVVPKPGAAPDLVRAVHAEYAAAGAEVLETNTFGANRVKLAQYGLEAMTGDINRAAARLAV